MKIGIQMRYATAAEWTAANTVLAVAEQGYETDTGKQKIGDGVTAWNALGYWAGGGAIGNHAAQHAAGQADAVTPAAIGAAAASHTQAATTITATATDVILGRTTAGAGAVEEIACTAAGRALVAGATAAVQRGTLSAYRDQTPSAAANVSGAAVAPNFAAALTLQWTLAGNVTSFALATNLASGETGEIIVTIGSYALPADPPSGAYKGAWTVTGPVVRIVIEQIGTAQYWTADSLEVVA